MKKYRGILLSVSVAAMLLGSCFAVHAEETEAVTEPATVSAEVVEDLAEGEISASDKSQLETLADQILQMITTQSEEITAPSSILSVYPEGLVTGAANWQAVEEELGGYAGIESADITAEDDIVIKALADFENGTNVVTITLDKKNLSNENMIESISFETAKQSMGAKMKEAVLNTIMGVCIVFLMLLFLSFLISQFKHISTFEAAMKKKNAPAPAPAAKPAVAAAPVVEEEVVDDGELIAVIAAAIAAAEGTSTDGFVVRSIKKSNRNKWQRA